MLAVYVLVYAGCTLWTQDVCGQCVRESTRVFLCKTVTKEQVISSTHTRRASPPAAEVGIVLRTGGDSEGDGCWDWGTEIGKESEGSIDRLYFHEKSFPRVNRTWPFPEKVGHINAIRLE